MEKNVTKNVQPQRPLKDSNKVHPMEKIFNEAYEVLLQPMEKHVRADIYTAEHEWPRTTAGGQGLKKAAATGEPTKQTRFHSAGNQ